MTKKILSVLVASALTAGCLAGCGGKEAEVKSGETAATTAAKEVQQAATQAPAAEAIPNFNAEGYPIVNEPITLKLLWCIADSLDIMPIEEFQQIKDLEATTGIDLDIELVKKSEFDTKYNLMFASGEYPDIIICSQGTIDYEEYGADQGILIPLDGLIEKYLPVYNERGTVSLVEPGAMLRASDGQLYTIPFLRASSKFNGNVTFMNYEWLKAVGMEKPETVDELTEVLRAFKTKDPNGNGQADEIPISYSKSGLNEALNLFGFPNSGSNFLWINNDKQVEFIPTADNYRTYLEWLHQLYAEELLDLEVFSQDANTFRAKINAGQVGVFSANNLVGLESQRGVSDLWYTEDSRWGWSLSVSSNDGAYITSTNKYPEASMRLFNYMLEWENQESFYNGPKDDPECGWKYSDDGTMIFYDSKTGDAKNVDVNRFSNSALCFVFPEQYVAQYELSENIGAQERYHYEDVMKTSGNIVKYSWHYLNMVKFDPETTEKIALIRTDMNTAIDEYRTNFIRDGVTDESWAEYCKVIEDMDIDFIVQNYQNGLDNLNVEVLPNEF